MVKEKIMQTALQTQEDLGTVFTMLQISLRNYLRRRISDPALVEDLIQDIFVKAVVAINANRAPKNLTGWLYAAARTTVVDYYRSMRPNTTELDENLLDTQHASDEFLHQELAMCLRPLTQQLPTIYRDTLLATDFDGKTMKIVAEEQSLSLSAIKSRVSRARSMLKEKLLDCCHVEMSDGTVIDYRRYPSNTCGGGCT